MGFSNKNWNNNEYYWKLFDESMQNLKHGVFYIIWIGYFLFKYLYKQSRIFKTISIRIAVFLSYICWCYYGCFSDSVCIQVYLLYHLISNLWLSVLFISTEKCVVCETESTSICFVPSFSRTLGGSHPLSFRYAINTV